MGRWLGPLALGVVVALAGAPTPVAAALQGASATAAVPGSTGDTSSAEGTVLFLVRHAEKAAEPPEDPPLTAEGRRRADVLAGLLADAGLDAVWSTDYERTRATAAPVAEGQGLGVELYDPRDLAVLAATLRDRGGRALVVGHSNTTPALVEALGGEPGPPIDEAAEYDRLYVLTLTRNGPVTTLLRFGRPFAEPGEEARFRKDALRRP